MIFTIGNGQRTATKTYVELETEGAARRIATAARSTPPRAASAQRRGAVRRAQHVVDELLVSASSPDQRVSKRPLHVGDALPRAVAVVTVTPSRSSIASPLPVLAPDGGGALPLAPPASSDATGRRSAAARVERLPGAGLRTMLVGSRVSSSARASPG